ncbi:MAG: glycosyltransferase family protein [Bacillota bacterium]
MSIWGDQAWRQTPLASHYRGPVFDPAKLREIYFSSKVNVNIHYMAFEVPAVTGTFTNQRPYEILGCGGFCITDWRQHTTEEFVHGKHLVQFRETDDFSELVDYYLQHEAERVSIAAQGHDLVHQEYTYEKRLLPLLDLLSKILQT